MAGRRSVGSPAERYVANYLTELGYLVSSRRHLKGPGDLLALPGTADHVPDYWGHANPALLVEVKATGEPPWRASWGPLERHLLAAAGRHWAVEPILAWLPPFIPKGDIIWLPPEDWPPSA